MTEPIYHTVTLTLNGEKQTYRHIVAIGMGHKLPNLVLVQQAPDMPETVHELNHLHFTSYSVRKKRTKNKETK